MKVKRVPHHPELILVDNGDENESYFAKIESTLLASFSAKKTKELEGLDEIYIDFDFEGNSVILAWNALAGISIVCKNADLEEKIFQHLQNLK
ncbi:hypothetical protein ACE1CD_36725 [Aerosakkonema sp. BLCC-F183]|uniref:hypothetical protein n=1 Tax=Aerosakkonema sp. BLCC-F183 TaxID=3342834 RepID=UPI0035BB7121